MRDMNGMYEGGGGGDNLRKQVAIRAESDSYRVKKAGFFIFGDVTKNGRAQRYVVAPYSEGRFDHSRRHFSLAKGSVDKKEQSDHYEDPWDAAIRETKEETGIDVVKLVGEENLKKLRDPNLAHTVKFPLTSPEYPGVLIQRVFTQPIADQICVTRNGDDDLRTQMFGIELAPDQITSGPIRKALKNTLDVHNGMIHRPADTRRGDVKEPVWKILKEHDAYPNRRDLMEWMMTGEMPERPWNADARDKLAKGNTDAGLTQEDTLLKGNEGGAWFRGILKRELGYVPEEEDHPRLERNQWRELYHHLPPEDQAKIQEMADHIKSVLKKIVPLMRDDNAVFKMDTSDIPFNIYQEGADVMPLSAYLVESIKEAKANSEYSRTFLGRLNESDPLVYGITHSQMGMAAAIARDADLEACRKTGNFVGLMQAQCLKFAEQQEKLLGAPIEPEASAALERSRTRTLATINDETTHGRSHKTRHKARGMREHATRDNGADEAVALG